MKVLVFGSLNIDHVYEVSHFVQPGETIASLGLQLFCGGKGLNQSVAFRRCGVETWHAGAVGREDSAMLFACLEAAGVHTELIQKKEGPSGHAIIQKTADGENGIVLYGGANQMIDREDVDAALAHFGQGDSVALQNEISQVPYIMQQAHKKGMKIALNPSPMNEKIAEMPLELVDCLILNEVEGAELSGVASSDSKGMLEGLVRRFPQAEIVLTLGKDGAVYGYREIRERQPIYPVQAVDTTAAGDTFTGFYVGSRMQGKGVREALDIAALASAIAVGRNGASPSIPTREEVERMAMA